MDRRRLGRLLLLASLLFACDGGEEPVECFDDRSCGAGMRCEAPEAGGRGTCVACDGTEVPYDGIDNDCDPNTPDSDLDGDGEDPPSAGGLDCDDTDPNVSSTAREVCMDARDNDCDGEIDEVDCGDRADPAVLFDRPAENDRVSGTIDVAYTVLDDVGVREVELSVGELPIDAMTFTPPVTSRMVTTTIDTVQRSLPDGPATIVVEVKDVAGKTGTTSRTVFIDNYSPPEITVQSPTAGLSYGGRMTIEADAQDSTGVQNVEILLNGALVGTFDMAPYRIAVETASIADGPATLTVRATDGLGNTGEETVEITIDNTPPEIRFLEPASGSNASLVIPVTVVAEDETSGVSRISCLDEAVIGSSTLTFSFDTENVPNGPYTLTATASDAVIVDDGARSNSANAAVTIDVANVDRGPTITLNLQDGDAVLGDTEIVANVTSPFDAIDPGSVQISVDGAAGLVSANDPTYTTSFDFTYHRGPTAVIEVRAADTSMRTRTVTASVTIARPPPFRIAAERDAPGISDSGYGVGDITGDGVPDVVYGGNELRTFTGTIADGDWRPLGAETIDAANGADDLQLRDLDGDTDLDLISLEESTVRVYFNTGAGLPQSPDVEDTFNSLDASTFDVGDLDGDGDFDVVIGCASGLDMAVLRNDNNTGFTLDGTYGLVGAVSDVEVADADDDGDLDVVVGRRGTVDVVTAYRNVTGNGVFGAGQDSFSNSDAPEFVAVADVTGDDYPDIVATIPAAGAQAGAVSVLAGDPATPGTFQEVFVTPVSRYVRGGEIVDWDGDTNLDVVVASGSGNGVEVLTNPNGNGDLTRAGAWVMTIEAHRPVLHDLDGDLDLDLLVSSRTKDRIAYAENLGGELLAAPVITLARTPRALGAGDVYGADGRPDLLLALTGPPEDSLRTYENQSGQFVSRGDFSLGTGTQPRQLEVGELDGAGGLDVSLGSSAPQGANGTAAIILNGGVNAAGDQLWTRLGLDIQQPQDTVIADVDNDGQDEAVFTFRQNNTPQVSGSEVWQALGGTPTQLRVHTEGFGAVAVAAGNLGDDPDGWIDYATANQTSADITVSLWNGAGWSSTSYTALPGLRDLKIGFVGSDGFGDLIGIGPSDLIVLEGGPGFTFYQPVSYPAGSMQTHLVTSDFTGDGLTDAITINSGGEIALLVARPNGGFFAPIILSGLTGMVDLVYADLDGDGRDDLAAAGTAGIMLIYSDADTL